MTTKDKKHNTKMTQEKTQRLIITQTIQATETARDSPCLGLFNPALLAAVEFYFSVS